jgi:hypothetical protein
MRRLRLVLLAALIGFGGLSGTLLTASVAADAPTTYMAASDAAQSAACAGLSQLDSTQGCGPGGQTAITKVVKAVLGVLSVVLGIAGVIMVVISGFKYITSNGDAGAVNSAKRTLIFALVGLAIAALSQFLVQFVINKARSAG